MSGRGARGRGDFFIRRGGRRSGDVRPSEDQRAQSVNGTTSCNGRSSGEDRPGADQRAHSRDGSGSPVTPTGPNATPLVMAAISPAIGVDNVGSSSPPEGGDHTMLSTTPHGDHARRETESSEGPSSTTQRGSSTGSTNVRGPYRGIGLEKSNRQRGCKLPVCMELCDGRPNQAAQASALASEMGLAVREMLALSGDWRTIPKPAKHAAWARIEARLDLFDIKNDPLKFEKAIKHMGLLHKRYRFEVKKNYRENAECARPAHHIDNEDWKKITEQWDAELLEETLNATENNGKKTKA